MLINTLNVFYLDVSIIWVPPINSGICVSWEEFISISRLLWAFGKEDMSLVVPRVLRALLLSGDSDLCK